MKLHIVNGDSTYHMLKDEGITDPIIPWRDVLHDGQVLALDNVNYDKTRANHLAKVVCSIETNANVEKETNDIKKSFEERRNALSQLTNYDQVVLWFEHDLYDQLQLIEVLTHSEIIKHDQVNLICINSHPDCHFFHGFGNLTPKQLIALEPNKEKVKTPLLKNAQLFWTRFLSDNPNELLKPHNLENSLPFFSAALDRYLNEFPLIESGLNHTQKLILSTIDCPASELLYLRYCLGLDSDVKSKKSLKNYNDILMSKPTFKRIFWQLQDMETAPFMGDLWIHKELKHMLDLDVPLISTLKNNEQTEYQLTDIGKNIINGKQHWLDHNSFDYWRGGVHISKSTPWQWDSSNRCFTTH